MDELTKLRQRISELEAQNLMYRESEEKFRNICESSPNMIFINAAGRIEYVNKTCMEIMGYAKEEFLGPGFNFFTLVADESKETAKRYYDVLMKGESVPTHELILLTKDGRKICTASSIKLMQYRGTRAILGIIADVTERKRAEDALRFLKDNLEAEVKRKTQELVDAQERIVNNEKLAAMGQLAGIIAHEFRNQLGIMRNAVYYLKMKLSTAEEKVKQYLDILEEEVIETDAIIENMLTFARTKRPEFGKVNLNDLILTSIEKADIPGSIELSVNVDQLQAEIDADPRLLSRAFVNILRNAVQSIDGSGKTENQIKVSSIKDGDWVKIGFKDTGRGMSEEDRKRLFEPLYTTRARGAGLGLVTVRIVTEGHGGAIDVDSKVGEGANVVIKLPVKQSESINSDWIKQKNGTNVT